jgi:hypothetical protein
MALLSVHFALVPAELEFLIAEARFAESGRAIDPQHVTTALQELRAERKLVYVSAATRGGGIFDTIEPANRGSSSTKIERIAARKRVLSARLHSWTSSSKRYPHGLAGPAGEASVRRAIAAAGTMTAASGGFGEVSTILGRHLAGPLDSGGFLVPIVSDLPTQPVTVLVEVKNIRNWIYPGHPELHQLLSKAAQVQQHAPSQPILPILVCRRAHKTTIWMAQKLGFFVIETKRQYLGDVDTEALAEVQMGLHLTYLTAGSAPDPTVTTRMRDVVPLHASNYAIRWQQTVLADDFGPYFDAIFRARTSSARAVAVATMKEHASSLGITGF